MKSFFFFIRCWNDLEIRYFASEKKAEYLPACVCGNAAAPHTFQVGSRESKDGERILNHIKSVERLKIQPQRLFAGSAVGCSRGMTVKDPYKADPYECGQMSFIKLFQESCLTLSCRYSCQSTSCLAWALKWASGPVLEYLQIQMQIPAVFTYLRAMNPGCLSTNSRVERARRSHRSR